MIKEDREAIIKIGTDCGMRRGEVEEYLDATISVVSGRAARQKIIEMVTKADEEGRL